MRWTKEQDAAIKKANGEFKAWLDDIGLKKGMSQKEPLPGASESVTAHRLAIAASLMLMKMEDGEPLFPQTEYYTKVCMFLRRPLAPCLMLLLVRANSVQELHSKQLLQNVRSW
jgi:hypothetical protein